jgi:hypothetical protein
VRIAGWGFGLPYISRAAYSHRHEPLRALPLTPYPYISYNTTRYLRYTVSTERRATRGDLAHPDPHGPAEPIASRNTNKSPQTARQVKQCFDRRSRLRHRTIDTDFTFPTDIITHYY